MTLLACYSIYIHVRAPWRENMTRVDVLWRLRQALLDLTRSSKKWRCLYRRQSLFGHVSELYTPLPSFRGAVETKVGHLAARTHLFAANLDVKRQSRTVTLRQRQQRVFSPPTRCYTAGNVGSRTGPKRAFVAVDHP